MTTFRVLNLLATISLMIVVCSLSAAPANALSAEGGHVVRHLHHGIAMKKKRGTQRCKHRGDPTGPSSAPPAPSAPAPPPTENPSDDGQSNGGDNQNNGGSDNNTGDNGNTGDNSDNGNTGDNGNNSDDQPPAQLPAPSQVPPPPPPPPPSPSPLPPSGGNNARKVLLGFPSQDATLLRTLTGPNVASVYNWCPYNTEAAPSLGLEYVPMIWGPKQNDEARRFLVPGYASIVLGANEPNEVTQANMSPGQAVQQWWEMMEPLKDIGYSLITPACTNAPSARQWYTEFFSMCAGCRIDGMALHTYSKDAQSVISYLEEMHNTYGLDIYVTEFACEAFDGNPCTMDEVWQFMTTTVNYMNSQPWIKAHSWFGAMLDMGNVGPNNRLVTPEGILTPLGAWYTGQ